MTAEGQRILEQALALSEEERRAVAKRILASLEEDDEASARRRARWDHLRAGEGIVNLGGNAVEDCERLYDE
jgi:hypothetical protein